MVARDGRVPPRRPVLTRGRARTPNSMTRPRGPAPESLSERPAALKDDRSAADHGVDGLPSRPDYVRPLQTRDESTPLVSVIMASYNFDRFVGRAIDSALAQDYPLEALEIILIDDGSTDDTESVVEPYRDRIRYIRTPNRGLISTVNRGLAEASGELISLLSGDDLFPPDKTRRQVDFLRAREEVGLVYGDLEVIDDHDRVIAESFWRLYGISPLRGRVHGALLSGNVVSGGALMVRASLKRHFHPIPEAASAEDWWIALRVAAVADIDYISEPVYGYRYHGDNMNLQAGGEKRASLLRGDLHFRRFLLAGVGEGAAERAELVSACGAFLELARHVASTNGDRIVPDARDEALRDEAMRDGQQAILDGDLDRAATRFTNALAHDPSSRAALEAIAALREAEDASPLSKARRFKVLAFADELVATPELLSDYGREFSSRDDATLVIHLPEGSRAEIVHRLAETVESLGLDGADGPDMLALANGEDLETVLAGGVGAIYSRRQGSAAAALPTVSAATALRGIERGAS
jgi:glycosyltransferase involved in cell wall biosynthesis